MGTESHSPKIWGKDQEKDLAFKAQTTLGNSSYDHPDHNYEKSDTPGFTSVVWLLTKSMHWMQCLRGRLPK